jgi:hypothetical protein
MQATQATPSQVHNLIEQLKARKEKLKNQRPVVEIINEVIVPKWKKLEERKQERFNAKLNELKQVVKLELALIDCVQDELSPEVIEQLKSGWTKLRITDNLQHLNGLYHKYRDNVKFRQILKLTNAVYRYNRVIISGIKDANFSIYKSRIKYATNCPHCGEISGRILIKLATNETVILPE